MLLPLGHEKMTPVHLALEVALHELTWTNGLHVTDVPDIDYTYNIDNSEAIKLLEETLAPLQRAFYKDIATASS